MPIAATTYQRPGADSSRRAAQSRYNRERRPEEHRFYGRQIWKDFREYLQGIPRLQLCAICKTPRMLKNQFVMDHIVPIRENWDLRLVESNIRALCRSCHERHGERVNKKRPTGCDEAGNPIGNEDW